MIFNQFEFLFLFLPAVVLLFHLPGLCRARVALLLVASLVFYGFSGLEHAVALVISILWVYAMTAGGAYAGNRWRLTAAILLPALTLVYYKYLGFLVSQFTDQTREQASAGFSLFGDVLLPAGISFFTFQLIAYAIDRFRGRIDSPPGFLDFALYISFFPQLVAGPILRFHQVREALARLKGFRPGPEDWGAAIAAICLGLAAKVLVADTVGNYITPYTAAPGRLDVITSFYVIAGYSFQIYFDFYGYSLIAIGLGRLFGFHFPQNFDRPYEALNGRDFWRRWHITLSFWIRDYLYLPLGGNERYVRNILIVFVVCGLWHGAGWTFVIWGAYHALFVLSYHWFSGPWDRMPALVQRGATFAIVSLGWVLFLFDFDGIAAFAHSLIGRGLDVMVPPTPEMWAALALAAWVCFGVRFETVIERCRAGLGAVGLRTAGLALLFVVSVLFIDRSNDFIYFRF